jgi:hypothetical protein
MPAMPSAPATRPGTVTHQVSQTIDDQLGYSLDGDLGVSEATIEDAKINALIYADPGVGKTTLAESANRHPNMAPVLFFNMEGGLLSVASRRPNKIDIASVDHLEALLHLYAQGDPRLTRFRTLVQDSASELQRVSLQYHIARRAQGRSGRSSINDIDRDDYGRMTVQLGRVLCMMRDLPVHTIITAHPTMNYPDGDRSGPPSEVFPAFTPRLAKQVMGFFDFVWFMYFTVDEEEQIDGNIREVETRYILTRDRGAYKAKTRGPRFREMLGERFENPSMPVLYDMLLSAESMGNDEETDNEPLLVSGSGPERFVPTVRGAVELSLHTRGASIQPSSAAARPTPSEAIALATGRETASSAQLAAAGSAELRAAQEEADEDEDSYAVDIPSSSSGATPEAAPAPPAPGSQGMATSPPTTPTPRPNINIRPQPSPRAPSATARAMATARSQAAQRAQTTGG